MKFSRWADHPRWLAVLTLAFALVPVWLAMVTYRDASEKDERLFRTSASVLGEQMQREFDSYTVFLQAIRTQALRLGDAGLSSEQVGKGPDGPETVPHLLAFGYAGDEQGRILVRWINPENAPVAKVGDDLASDPAIVELLKNRSPRLPFPQFGKVLAGHRFLVLQLVPKMPDRFAVRGYVLGWLDLAAFCRKSTAPLLRDGVLTARPLDEGEALPDDAMNNGVTCGSGRWDVAVARGPAFSQEYGAPAPWLAFLAAGLSAVPLLVLATLAGRSAKLRTALTAEQELLRQQRYFTQSVSHEFRTPLGIILSGADLLDQYANHLSPERRKEVLTEIRDNTVHMSDMIERVLLLGRIDSSRLSCEPAPVNVAALCHQIADKVTTAARLEGVIRVTAPDSVAMLDAALLGSILDNLLSNAVKYSPPGKPVTLTAMTAPEQIVFTVQDEGIGIPVEDLPRVCDPFHRCGNVGDTPGTGLGLAIVQRCTALHGGTLKIESTAGAGTTATVTIPIASTT